MDLSEFYGKLEKIDWIRFYRKEAGLATDEEFERMVGIPVNWASEIEAKMKADMNPILFESVKYYWCTGMRDREKSESLLVEAAEQGDALAKYILEEREGKW